MILSSSHSHSVFDTLPAASPANSEQFIMNEPPTPPRSQPRSVPSPVFGQHSPSPSNSPSLGGSGKFSSIFKLGSRPGTGSHSSSHSSRMSAQSPRSSQHHGFNPFSPPTMFSGEYGPFPPASPTPSADSQSSISHSPKQSLPKFLKRRTLSPHSSPRMSYSFPMRMLTTGSRRRDVHLAEPDPTTERNTRFRSTFDRTFGQIKHNRNSANSAASASSGGHSTTFEDSEKEDGGATLEEEDDDDGNSSIQDDGSFFLLHQNPDTEYAFENEDQPVPRNPPPQSYSQHRLSMGDMVLLDSPTSPPFERGGSASLPSLGLVESRSENASSSSVVEYKQEIQERQKPLAVPEILQARLSASYVGDGRPGWSKNSNKPVDQALVKEMMSGNWTMADMEGLDAESMEELRALMADMNTIENDSESEVRMLMEELTSGEEVVRKASEIPKNEVVRSPQLPPEYYLHDSLVPFKYSQPLMAVLSPVSAGYVDEDEAETSLEIQHLMDELSYGGSRDIGLGLRIVPRERPMAEDEGLNEMPSEEVRQSVTTFQDTDDEAELESDEEEEVEREIIGYHRKQDQEEISDMVDIPEQEHELAVIPSYVGDFLDNVVEDMEHDIEELEQKELKELEEQLQAVLEIEQAISAGNSRARSRPQSKIYPNTHLDVPGRGLHSSGSSKSGNSSDEEPSLKKDKCKGKGKQSQRSGEKPKIRPHNLKENEVRVEDPAYLAVFKAFLASANHSDSFICRQPRFDSFHTRRICNEIPHEYRPLPPPPPAPIPQDGSGSNSNPNDRLGHEAPLPEEKQLSPEQKREKEVSEEILARLWVFMASKWLYYGRLITGPSHELLRQSSTEERRKEAKSGPKRRILDLGGAPVADWGWHCAFEYPHCKVYTVTSRPQNINIDNVPIEGLGVIEKRRFRGPPNHRHIKVTSLWKLPFPDNHFDVISARSLHMILKQRPPTRRGKDKYGKRLKPTKLDEYALTIRECFRILRPGGYFEFNLVDCDLVNAGPMVSELGEKFSADLKGTGYDPTPTTKWISRLDRAGFVEVKRAWMVLPMASTGSKQKQAPKRELSDEPMDDLQQAKAEAERELEAWSELGVVKGSTDDVACVTGLVGTWKWEEWMIKLDGERATPEGKNGLVKGIGATLSEGRDKGSGWRTLVGWARKPTKRERALMKR